MADNITDLQVSYGSALLQNPLRKVVGKGGLPVNVNPGSGQPTYLWIKSVVDEPAVVEVRILYDEEPVPEGFTKVQRDLSSGSGPSSFICFKTGAATARGIASILVLAEGEDAGEWDRAFLRDSAGDCRAYRGARVLPPALSERH